MTKKINKVPVQLNPITKNAIISGMPTLTRGIF